MDRDDALAADGESGEGLWDDRDCKYALHLCQVMPLHCRQIETYIVSFAWGGLLSSEKALPGMTVSAIVDQIFAYIVHRSVTQLRTY